MNWTRRCFRALSWLLLLLLPSTAITEECSEGRLELTVAVAGSKPLPADLECRYSFEGSRIHLSEGRGCVERNRFFQCRSEGTRTAYLYADDGKASGKIDLLLQPVTCRDLGQDESLVRIYHRGNGGIQEIRPGGRVCPEAEPGAVVGIYRHPSATVEMWPGTKSTGNRADTLVAQIDGGRWPAAYRSVGSLTADVYPPFLAEGAWPQGLAAGISRLGIEMKEGGQITLKVPISAPRSGIFCRVRFPGTADLLLRAVHDPREIRATWSEGEELTGRLRWPDGRPAGKLLLSLLDPKETELLDQTVSDPDGRFVLEPEQGGLVRFVVGEPGFPLFEEYWDASREDRREETIRAGSVMVAVRDDAGMPVTGVQIVLHGVRGGRVGHGSIVRISSDHGVAPFPVVPTGSVVLELSRVGFSPTVVGPIPVTAGGVEPVVVQLHAGTSVKGTVLDADGVGVEGATLCWTAKRDKKCTNSGRAGAFELSHLPRGIVRITATHKKKGTASEWFDLRREAFIELHLSDSAAVYGRIEGWQEEDGVDVKIGVVGHPDSCVIEAEGRFLCSGLPPGRHRLEMKSTYEIDQSERSIQAKTIMLEAGERKEVVFEMGSAVTGTVRENGESAPGWILRWMRWENNEPGGNLPRSLVEARTTESGRYRVLGVVPGSTYTVALIGEGRTYLEEVTVEGDEVDFELQGESVRGQVTNKLSGEGLEGTEIIAYGSKSWPASSRQWPDSHGEFAIVRQARGRQRIVTAGRDGFFELRLEDGPWTVRGTRRGFIPGKEKITVGGGRQIVDLELTPSGGVWGQVLDSGGQSRPLAAVYAYCRSVPNVVHNSFTSETGWFTFDSLRGRTCALLAVAPEGMGMVPAFQPRHGKDDPEFVSIGLSPVGSLAVLLPQGAEAVARLNVPLRIVPEGGLDIVPFLRRLKAPNLRVRIEHAGSRYEVFVPALPAGHYRVSWPGQEERAAEILAGAETHLEF